MASVFDFSIGDKHANVWVLQEVKRANMQEVCVSV